MPFKPPETKKCPACGQSVYAAEERKAGDEKYHKMCFKCMMCNKMLELSNYAPHEAGKEIYCKQCHGRKYGPKGVGFGVGAGCMSTDSGKQFENWALEPYMYNGGVPSPSASGRGTPGPARSYNYSSSAPGAGAGPGPDGYKFLPFGYQHPPGFYSAAPAGGGGGGNPQYSSGSTGYSGTDERGGRYSYQSDFQHYSNQWGGDYHGVGTEGYNPGRFGGGGSGGSGDSGRSWQQSKNTAAWASNQDRIPNQSDYGQTIPIYSAQAPPAAPKPAPVLAPVSPRPPFTSRAYHPRGYGSSIAGDRCPRCNKSVYAAERRLSQGAAWHRQCFTCKCCHTSLDATNCCDANYEIWCKTCHNRFFGIKGVGFGVGAGVLTTRK